MKNRISTRIHVPLSVLAQRLMLATKRRLAFFQGLILFIYRQITLFQILVLFIFLSLPVEKLLAQPSQLTAPSAAVYNYSKYAESPPNLFTGAVSEYIPMGQISAGPLSHNVGLSYYFAGHRPSDLASPAGLGFHIQAGGAIVRQVLGLDDFDTDGWLDTGNEVQGIINLSPAQINDYLNEELDPQADIYSLHVGGGLTIKFFMDHSGNIHTVPTTDLKITYETDTYLNGSIIVNYFLLKDTQGNRYYFGQDYNSVTQSLVDNTEKTTFDNKEHISAWYLYKIETHDQLHAITFDYTGHFYSYYSLQDCEAIRWTGGYVNNQMCNMTAEEVTINGRLLTHVKGLASSADFNYATGRIDLLDTPQRLASVDINSGSYSRTFTLSHGYFSDNQLTQAQTTTYLNMPTPAYNAMKNKLRLGSISIAGTGTGTPATLPSYDFDYYRPHKLVSGNYTAYATVSKAIDEYGFANGQFGNNSKYEIIPHTTVISHSIPLSYGNLNGIRSSNSNFSVASGLYKMTLPTGGTITYDYEGNEYRNLTGQEVTELYVSATHLDCFNNGEDIQSGVFNLTQQEIDYGRIDWNLDPQCGINDPAIYFTEILQNGILIDRRQHVSGVDVNGSYALNTITPPLQPATNYTLRIRVSQGTADGAVKHITSGSDDQIGGIRLKSKTTNDSDIDPTNNIIRSYSYDDAQGNSSGKRFKVPVFGYGFNDLTNSPNALFTTTSLRPFTSYDGAHVGYDRVVEDLHGNGEIIHEFYSDPGVSVNSIFPPTPERPERSLWGQHKETSVLREVDQAELQKTRTIIPGTEHGKTTPSQMFAARKVLLRTSGGGTQNVYFDKDYTVNTGFFRPSSIDHTLEGLTYSVDYEYSSSYHLQPDMISQKYSNEEYKHELTYTPDDNSGSQQAIAMADRNIIVPYIDEYSMNGLTVSKEETVYAMFNTNTHPRPHLLYRDYFDQQGNPMRETDDYVTYNSKGLLTAFRRHGYSPSVDESFVYDSNSLLTKAGPLNLQKEYFYHGNSNLFSQIKEVDGTSTTFTYDGLMRLKTSTDPVGSVTTYTYDISKNITGHASKITISQTFPADLNGFSQLTNLTTHAYLDGLGRTVQTVGQAQAYNGQDQVSAVAYDSQGRQNKTYETYTSGVSTGAYSSSFGSQPATTISYEASALNRPLTITPPDFGTRQFTYGTNSASFTDANNNPVASNTVYERTVIDGNNNKSRTYTDIQGRKLLDRRMDSAENPSSFIDTKYDYDWRNLLEEVVPPGSTLGHTSLNFNYTRDKEGKIIQKKLPSKDPIDYVYDDRDLLIGYQDGYMRSQTQPWYVYKYDDFGRETNSGFHTSQPTNGNTTPATELNRTTYGTAGTAKGKITFYESRLLGTTSFIEAETSYDPQGRVDLVKTNNVLQTNFRFNETDPVYDGASNVIKETNKFYDHQAVITTVTNTSLIDDDGRLIGEKIKLNNFIEQQLCEMTYSGKDQILVEYQGGTASSHLQQINYNYLANRALHQVNGGQATGSDIFGYQINYNQNFSGWNPGNNQLNGNIKSTGWHNNGENIYVQYYGYDHLNRLLNVSTGEKVSIGAGGPTNANYNNTTYSYDNRGNFIDVTRKHRDKMIDNLHYNYVGANANQLESIDETANSANGYLKKGPGTYAYDNNGNMISDPQKGLTVLYNHLDLPETITWSDGRRMEMTYDADGHLHRRELFDENGISVRKHEYLGQLEYLDGFKYAITHPQGRMVNSGLEGYLEYLYLDHQQSSNGLFEAQRIESTGKILDQTTEYDAQHKIKLSPGFTVHTNAIFSASTAHAPTYTEVWRYEYDITDHLGNLKLVYSDVNGNGSIDPSSEILMKTDYFPYGLHRDKDLSTTLENKYQFNGIDHVGEFGLDWEMAAFRSMDSRMGVWTGVDPRSEELMGSSPYTVNNCNPISFSDPDGDLPFLAVVGIGALIGGGVHTAAHLVTNNFTFNNWNWGSFAGSVLAGGVGGGVSTALTNAGIGGFVGGSITGASSGFSQNLTSGLINGNLSLGGLAQSTFLGAGIGGGIQGLSAAIDGRNFWDGRKLISSEVLATDPNVRAVQQRGTHNCGPACIEAIDPRYTQEQARAWFGGDPNSKGIEDLDLWDEFSNQSGRLHQVNIPQDGLVNQFPGIMNRGRTIALNINTASSSAPGHSVIMRSISQNTYQKVNGQLSSKLIYRVMDPARGAFTNISRNTIMGAHKIFIVRPYIR